MSVFKACDLKTGPGQADSAFRISSSKPSSIEELTAKMSSKKKEFRLINLPFHLINQLERFTRQL
ncbi:hypothetical protein CR161_11535 [Prosthecochloris sp. ZM]|uniref:hypothetical protein n=1 Tax=Prosthecochloris sp. ZM TaxID=2283143 RepID=UPI000E169929|nr:hypothetical protein [Prosthecochloris sp. ZM]RDD31276.1 hypothetical protein CR161_11535 [Prosthecochloris sp. ZM]